MLEHGPMSSQAKRQYKYYDLVMVAFVTVSLCSNLIGASKICQIDLFGKPFVFGAGIFFFPISYIFGDILTEVYGYARARKVVWAGFSAQIFASLMSMVVIEMPPAPFYQNQAALETIFGGVPRIVAASLIAFFCGEFANSYTLAKMKIWTQGKHLWSRTIGSTLVGEAVDSIIFYPLAFLGIWAPEQVVSVMIANYFLKSGWEVVMTPFTYGLVGWLKKAENEDYYDTKTNFTPFSIET